MTKAKKPAEPMYRVTFNGVVIEAATFKDFKAKMDEHFAQERLKLNAAYDAVLADPKRY